MFLKLQHNTVDSKTFGRNITVIFLLEILLQYLKMAVLQITQALH